MDEKLNPNPCAESILDLDFSEAEARAMAWLSTGSKDFLKEGNGDRRWWAIDVHGSHTGRYAKGPTQWPKGTVHGRWSSDYVEQMRRASEMAQRMDDIAREVGATVVHDEIMLHGPEMLAEYTRRIKQEFGE